MLVFPTAGGDAEEIERFKMIHVLEPLIAAGRIKIYSCDSVAGRVWFNKEGSPEHRMWMTHQFHQYVKHEVVPAIRTDCKIAGHPDLGDRLVDRRVPRRRRHVPLPRHLPPRARR